MSEWWYTEKSKKIGPIQQEELSKLFQNGKITPNTMVWKEGMPEWKPLGNVEALESLKVTLPPPLPPKSEPDVLSLPLANRWPRFFARIFDVWWQILAVSLVAGYTLGTYSAGFVEWINGPGASQLFGIACLPVALMLDALIYKAAGNTPGKAILGLKVTTLNGQPLSLGQYLGRNLSLWVSGLAFGLPLINLFTLANQSSRLGKGKQASYDESTGYRVHAKPSGWIRIAIFSLAFISLFFVMAILNSMEQAAQRDAILNYSQNDYSWENPATKISTEIESNWKHSASKNEDQQEIYMFNEFADRAVVVFAEENAPGFTLQDYVAAFRKSTASNMRFSDGGRFFQKQGVNAWSGTGSMVDSGTNRLTVEIRQHGSEFWRVVTIQVMPYAYSDDLVQKLSSSLWSTVK